MLSNYKVTEAKNEIDIRRAIVTLQAGRAAAAGLDKKDESRRGVVPQLRPRPSTSR